MLKHVQISPMRNRADTLSIRSSISSSSSSCASSMCGSPEPETPTATVSVNGVTTAVNTAATAAVESSTTSLTAIHASCRASSYSSLNEMQPQTTIKIFTSCLRIDIEYKTLGIQWNSTSKDVVGQLLRRCKIRQRDPRLFYLCMKISMRRAGIKTVLVLEDDASPAVLQACYPKGDTQFYLQMKPGGLIRVQTAVLQPASQYKSLLIAEETTSDELLQLLLRSYKSAEPVERFSVYEVSADQEYQRKLHPDDTPLRAQLQRQQQGGEPCQFMVRENPQYQCRSAAAFLSDAADIDHRMLIVEEEADHAIVHQPADEPMVDFESEPSTAAASIEAAVPAELTPPCSPEMLHTKRSPVPFLPPPHRPTTSSGLCNMCKYTFKSCDYCHKNKHASSATTMPTTTVHRARPTAQTTGKLSSPAALAYSPVYNIREIRTMRQSFSTPANTKRSLTFGRPFKLTETGAGGVAI